MEKISKSNLSHDDKLVFSLYELNHKVSHLNQLTQTQELKLSE